MKDHKTCKHYKAGDCIYFGLNEVYENCSYCESYERKAADIYRDAETVPIVTEQAEPTIKIALDELTTIADSEFEKAIEKGAVKLVYEPEHDAVNHPEHYTSGGIECIDCIKAALGSAFIGFLMGNVIKYSYRYKDKNGIEDLKKARWYLDRAIKELTENDER